MKKIFNILTIAFVAAVTLTACSDDDDKWVGDGTSTLQVLSRETSFPAAASQGTIVVDTTDPVTVTSSDQGWVTTAVSGNTISVNVTDNSSLESRVSTLTIKAGDKKTEISVMQAGLIFDTGGVLNIGSGDAATTLTYPLKANAPVTVTTDADWCKASVEDGALVVAFDENTTGHVRRCNVFYKIGTIEDKIPVAQCDFAKDIAGQWVYYYYNDNGQLKGFYADVVKSGSKYYLDLGDGDKVPLTFNATTGTLSIKGGQFIRSYTSGSTTYHLHTVLWDTKAGYLTWNASAGLAAELTYMTLSDGTPVTVGLFEDDGMWGSYTATALRLEKFTSKTLSSTARKGSYFTCIQPYILKVHDTPEAASVATSPAISVPARSMVSPIHMGKELEIRNAERVVRVDATTARIVR